MNCVEEINGKSFHANRYQIERNIKIPAQKVQKIPNKARMEKLEEDSNGLQLWFLKTC